MELWAREASNSALRVTHIYDVYLPALLPFPSSDSSPPHTQDIWNACVFTLYATFALHIVIILFGAPFVQCVYASLSPPLLTPVHSCACF